MPRAVVNRLSAALVEVLAMPDTRQRLNALELEPGNGSVAEMKAQLEGDYDRWQKLAQELNIKPVN